MPLGYVFSLGIPQGKYLRIVFQHGNVFSNTHDPRERHGALIKCLEEVGKNHDGQDSSIDQLLETLVLRFRDVDRGCVHVFGDFGIDTVVVHVVLFHAGVTRHDTLDLSNVSLVAIHNNLGGVVDGIVTPSGCHRVRRSYPDAQANDQIKRRGKKRLEIRVEKLGISSKWRLQVVQVLHATTTPEKYALPHLNQPPLKVRACYSVGLHSRP